MSDAASAPDDAGHQDTDRAVSDNQTEAAASGEPGDPDDTSDLNTLADPSADLSAEDPAPTVEELIRTVETVTAERDTHLADMQRITAEFANFRKQSLKRHTEVVDQAAARLAGELLPVLDALDAAVEQGVEGIDPVREQLLRVLEKEGLEVLAEVGEAFDPHRHEAAMTQPAEEGDDGPVVGQVLRAGYGWNGRVLRAAMVAVRG